MSLQDQILQALLKLPLKDRLELAQKLLQDLSPKPLVVTRVRFGKADSSCIREVEYDTRTQELTLTFFTGNAYHYNGVPVDVVMDLVRATSGMFYNYRIKGEFPCRKAA